MDCNKAFFASRANAIGVLFVRIRGSETDRAAWDAIEITLNNGEIFLLSGTPVGQGRGEQGLYVDTNCYTGKALEEIRELSKIERSSKIKDFFQEYHETVE